MEEVTYKWRTEFVNSHNLELCKGYEADNRCPFQYWLVGQNDNVIDINRKPQLIFIGFSAFVLLMLRNHSYFKDYKDWVDGDNINIDADSLSNSYFKERFETFKNNIKPSKRKKGWENKAYTEFCQKHFAEEKQFWAECKVWAECLGKEQKTLSIEQVNGCITWNAEEIKDMAEYIETYLHWAQEQCNEHIQASTKEENPLEPLADEVRMIFNNAVNEGLMEKAGEKYEWVKTASLYGYFIEQISDNCNLKHSNGRIQWKYFDAYVINQNSILSTAKQAVNDYRNKGLNPPEGDDIVNRIIKDL